VRLNLLRTICILFVTCIASVTGAFAQSSTAATFTTLIRFDGTNGSYPDQALIQGVDGNLYGASFYSDFFKVTSAGALTLFPAQPNYGYPFLSTLGTDGNFYGAAFEGGTEYQGSVFQMTPDGQLATLYSFCDTAPTCTGGPWNGVTQGSDGNFYGTTNFLPSSIFKITPGGVLTNLYFFDDTRPANNVGPLVEGTDGNLYGIDGPAIFTVTPEGEVATLHTFCMLANCADGSFIPAVQNSQQGPLVQAADENFYGETEGGGASDPKNCTYGLCGTIFVMTPQGSYRVIHSFCVQERCPDGDYPIGGLTLGSDGNLYGVTQNGGAYNRGTIFRVTAHGALTTLHSFDVFDGTGPNGLVQATNGTFYGAMQYGPDICCGSIFSLSVGLAPFVKTVPTIGNVGGTVIILGNDLTSASSVTFNGIPAVFTVVSDTEITATVPDGATTGSVDVTTSNGTLKSNLPFQVGFASASGFGGPGWNADQNLP
jgi:uncharacterized repeat protein (TIGR03803 family)